MTSARNRSRGRKRKKFLKVTMRSSDELKIRAKRTGTVTLAGATFLGLGYLAFLGLSWIGSALFEKNDRYKIEHLDIKAGESITRERILDYTGIRKGTNLFAIDIEKVRTEFLSHVFNVKSMTITRQLPDALRIEIIERIPLTRIRQKRLGDLVVDDEGCVFAPKSAMGILPVITGYEGKRLRPGSRLEGMALAAVHVLDECENPMLGLRIKSIEAGSRECLFLHILHAGQIREFKFAWKGMGVWSPESRQDLLHELSRVAETLHHKKSLRYTRFDATYDTMIIGQ